MDYWQRLDQVIQREPIDERDRFFHAMLQPLGMEKGKPFKPNARQTKSSLTRRSSAKQWQRLTRSSVASVE